MAAPMFDCAVRTTSVTASNGQCGILPQSSAMGTGRIARLRQIVISNTTVTAFTVGWALAAGAGTTPGGNGTILRRQSSFIDAAPVVTVPTTYATWPVIPAAGFNGRLTIPASGTLIWNYNEGEELIITPAATGLPFIIWNIGTGQIADITLSWTE